MHIKKQLRNVSRIDAYAYTWSIVDTKLRAVCRSNEHDTHISASAGNNVPRQQG